MFRLDYFYRGSVYLAFPVHTQSKTAKTNTASQNVKICDFVAN